MEQDTQEQNRANLPDFLWLLRDVDSIPASEDGQKLSPTDFMQQILRRNKSCKDILQYFRSHHCLYLPPPSSDSMVLSDITSNLENLSVQFNQVLEEAVKHVLCKVKVKIGCSGSIKCDGSMLACLIEQHFMLINKQDSGIPTFQVSWLMAVEVRFRRIAESIVNEYDVDMRGQLKGKLPIREGLSGETGETLLNNHLQVFAKKRLKFQEEIALLQSQSFHEKLGYLELSLIEDFDYDIADLDRSVNPNRVTGGRLFKFIQENIKSSEDFCSLLYNEKYSKIVGIKLQNHLSTQMPGTIDQELSVFCSEYFDGAVGPAIDSVYRLLRAKCSELESDLKLIPGPVEELEVVGVDADRVKLRWKPPEINLSSVVEYEILIKSKGKDWEVISTRKGCSVLVIGLQCSKWYCLSVRAKSKKYKGNKVQFVRVRTLMSKTMQNTVHASAVVASPIVYPCMVAYAASGHISRGIQTKSPVDVLMGGLMLSMVPATAIIGLTPVAGQLASSDTYKKEIGDRLGDLSETDTEVLQWNASSCPSTESCGESELNVDVPSETDCDSDCDFITCLDSLQDLEESSDEAL